jgi:hypothetical protein
MRVCIQILPDSPGFFLNWFEFDAYFEKYHFFVEGDTGRLGVELEKA